MIELWLFDMSLFIVLLIVLRRFRRLHRDRAARFVSQWRDHGRQWAIYGEAERSRWCHENADWWDQDWLSSITTPRPGKRPPTKL